MKNSSHLPHNERLDSTLVQRLKRVAHAKAELASILVDFLCEAEKNCVSLGKVQCQILLCLPKNLDKSFFSATYLTFNK